MGTTYEKVTEDDVVETIEEVVVRKSTSTTATVDEDVSLKSIDKEISDLQDSIDYNQNRLDGLEVVRVSVLAEAEKVKLKE